MKMIWRIAKTELQTLFYSPVAWIILAIFAVQSGIAFVGPFDNFVRNSVLERNLWNVTAGLFGVKGLFGSIQQYIYIYLPLITMGLMSRELSTGSIKLLYSSPVCIRQIILGKFVSMMVYGLSMIAILFIYVLFAASVVDNFDWSPVFIGLLGIYLLFCTYSAIGLLISSMLSYQIAVAVTTFTVFTALNYIGTIGQDVPLVRDITYWFSLSGRSNDFINGMIGTEDLLYFLIVISLALSLAVMYLRIVRHRCSIYAGVVLCMLLISGAMVCGYVSSRPSLKFYFDTTAAKTLTLSETSQKVVSKLDDGLTITTYVNLLDKNFSTTYAMPKYALTDINRFRAYTRFKPEIKFEYVYYYNQVGETPINRDTLRERARLSAQASRIKFSRFKTPEEIEGIIDLREERNLMVRKISRENGASVFLRVYEDMQKLPTEREITAALLLLTDTAPTISFYVGNRDIHGIKRNRDFGQLITYPNNRTSVVNLGYKLYEWNGKDQIPENVESLYIIDLYKPLSKEGTDYLKAYLDSGGNLFIACDANNQDVMNPIAALVETKFLKGTLIQENQSEDVSFITSVFTGKGFDIMPALQRISTGTVTMSGACGLLYDTLTFKVDELLKIKNNTAWNRVVPINRMQKDIFFDGSIGDTKGEFPTMIAMTRDINSKQQRIIVSGDADFLSNGELSVKRNGIMSVNSNFTDCIMNWLGNNKLPLNVAKKTPPDRKINFEYETLYPLKASAYFVLPLLILISGLGLWIKRRLN